MAPFQKDQTNHADLLFFTRANTTTFGERMMRNISEGRQGTAPTIPLMAAQNPMIIGVYAYFYFAHLSSTSRIPYAATQPSESIDSAGKSLF